MEKLTITPSNGSAITCMFNPTKFSVSKNNNYCVRRRSKEDTGVPSFSGGGAFQFTLDELIFDITEEWWWSNIHTQYIEPLLDLMAYDETTGEPPTCEISWGDFDFVWGDDNEQPLKKVIITDVDVTYTLFDSYMEPLRAKVKLTIAQAEDESDPPQNPTTISPARKTWIVTGGETLDWIAYKEYGDSAHWRYIAEMNNLSDPRQLYPGQILRVPPLKR